MGLVYTDSEARPEVGEMEKAGRGRIKWGEAGGSMVKPEKER